LTAVPHHREPIGKSQKLVAKLDDGHLH
jgi:hypothetical protein